MSNDNSHHPTASLYNLPIELKLAIFDALVTNIDPVPATAIAGARDYIAVRSLRKTCARFWAVFQGYGQPATVQNFLMSNNFRFNSSAELESTALLAPAFRLRYVRAMRVESRWMKRAFSKSDPMLSTHSRHMHSLSQFTGLRTLQLDIGAIDEADGYGCRRWMSQGKFTRNSQYGQILRKVAASLPNLSQQVTLEVLSDTHAGWQGPELWREARTFVRLRYRQTVAGRWRSVGDPDEREEQVDWMPDAAPWRARQRRPSKPIPPPAPPKVALRIAKIYRLLGKHGPAAADF